MGLVQRGLNTGLHLHRFKRSAALPRIQKTLGLLKSLCPACLLDIGTGRGTFLWPLLDTFPHLQTTCTDLLDYRIMDLEAAARGGIQNLRPLRMDAGELGCRNFSPQIRLCVESPYRACTQKVICLYSIPMRTSPHQIYKYPRTQHIQGSRLQPGDEDLDSIPFEHIAGRHLVIEEKMDGANCAISFTATGGLKLQSRGHYLVGGKREKHFDLFKTWAGIHAGALFERLGCRYIVYGEWLYAKHTIYYNQLPHYFLEFDVLDTETGLFLSTLARENLLRPLPFIQSVKVLYQGCLRHIQELTRLIGPSHFISGDHVQQLCRRAVQQGLSAERVQRETDATRIMEGLYIKAEHNGSVTDRYKWVRAGFLTTVLQSQSHWLNRPILANLLADGVDLFNNRL